MNRTNQNAPHSLTRRAFTRISAAVCGAGVLGKLSAMPRDLLSARERGAFVHPGILHSTADLLRMRHAVAHLSEPIYAGFLVLRKHPLSQLNYRMHGGRAEIGRNPTVNIVEFDEDANASYQCAIMFAITGKPEYAALSRKIIGSWSSTLVRITGRDAVLAAGLGSFQMINAAEILRYRDAGWRASDTQQFSRMSREVIYPVLKDYALFANGNWDTAALKCVLALGVFLNDRAIFENALQYYLGGSGDGRLTHYIYRNGQCQESGRDQQHTQLGIGHMGDCCEIAWNQGLNLYECEANRLLLGFEYTAKYNLGGEVPFTPDCDRTGKYRHGVISPLGRGRLRPIYEQIYNHYQNRAGVPAYWASKAAAKIRPSGAGWDADETGFGTLLYTRQKGLALLSDSPLQPPAGMVAREMKDAVHLSWIAVIGAHSYKVFRAGSIHAPFVPIGHSSTPEFTDDRVQPNRVYAYKMVAVSRGVESTFSLPIAICVGLPKPWKQRSIAGAPSSGTTSFDGEIWTVAGGGHTFMTSQDSFQYAHAPATHSCSLVARFVPQEASSFAQFGVMLRSDLTAGAPHSSLVVVPHMVNSPEQPTWKAILLVRATADHPAVCCDEYVIPAPVSIYGRLMSSMWLRLKRSKGVVEASFSIDGRQWVLIGRKAVSLPPHFFAGLAVSSGLDQITTSVKFDHVSLNDEPLAD